MRKCEGRLQSCWHNATEFADFDDYTSRSRAACFDQVTDDRIDKIGGDRKFVHNS